MWLKWRHNFADSHCEWKWEFLGVVSREIAESEARELMYQAHELYDWSEHYRGTDHEVVDRAPVTVIEEALSEATRIAHAKQVAVAGLMMELEAEQKRLSEEGGCSPSEAT